MISVIPKHIKLKYWAATILADFPNDSLPILRDETQWGKWASAVAGTTPFQRAGVPNPLKNKNEKLQEKDWQEWAMTVYNIMNSSNK